jgi:hypothetical protein
MVDAEYFNKTNPDTSIQHDKQAFIACIYMFFFKASMNRATAFEGPFLKSDPTL